MGTHKNITVCEIDIVNSTQWCITQTPEKVYNAMSVYDTFVGSLLQGTDVHKFELVGDSMLLISVSSVQMVQACYKIIENITYMKRNIFCDDLIDLRMGMHVGDLFGGVLNEQRRGQLFGKVINIASRLEQLAIPGTIHVSETVYMVIQPNRALTNMFSIGKTRLYDLKGIGHFSSVCLFPKRENCLIADDDRSQVMVLNHFINKQFNSTSLNVTCIEDCFNILRKQYFDEVVVLDRFFMDTDAVPALHAFRKWETDNRRNKQQVIMISAEQTSNVEHFILKDNSLYSNFQKLFYEIKNIDRLI